MTTPFDTYRTTYMNYVDCPDNFEAACGPRDDPLEFYKNVIEHIRNKSLEAIYMHAGMYEIERSWYAAMAPEFKVHPDAVDMLATTRIDIDARYFKTPYDAFSIRFPRHFLREDESCPYVKGIVVTTILEPPMPLHTTRPSFQVGSAPQAKVVIVPHDAPKIRKLNMMFNFDADDRPIENEVGSGGALSAYCQLKFPLADGKTIDEQFEAMRLVKPDEGYWPSRAFYKKLVMVVTGASFFGASYVKERRSPIVSDDKPDRAEKRKIEKLIREKIEKPSYSIGRDLVVPHRFASETIKSNETTQEREEREGRELSYAHIRCGHLAWYRRGPRTGSGDYVLKWINPTIVRADLPWKSQQAKATPHIIKRPKGDIIKSEPENFVES